ncbi:hypothetical protein H074_25962 [Amycolatopsis decaplanina DSM 44594]|uniref:Uncharacterized protein n=2 Tax=Amycolatopsis decaplanina TaxID=208441 RepID=M2Z336_9PSEU|nr:hypothetical protein H074_25962 [Amycolatopsis decaplanina DSM 44594]
MSGRPRNSISYVALFLSTGLTDQRRWLPARTNVTATKARGVFVDGRSSSSIGVLMAGARTKPGEYGQLETAPKAIALERLKPRPTEEEQGF